MSYFIYENSCVFNLENHFCFSVGNGDFFLRTVLVASSDTAHCSGGGPGAVLQDVQGFHAFGFRQFQTALLADLALFAADGNPTVLWDVLAEKCASCPEFKRLLNINLIGKTDEQILNSIEDAGLKSHLVDMGYQPHSIAIEEQRNASLLILPLRKEPEYKAVLPGKLFEYLASWRPVLGIGQPDGAMSMILNTTKTGIVLNWEDKASISRFIDLCWKNHLKGELTVEDADISQFTRRNLTRRMAQLFKENEK